MKEHYSNILFHSTLNKYQKYFSRLNKKIRNGSFYQMTLRKRNALVRKVEKLRMKLEIFQSGMVKYAGAGALALTLGIGTANAQGPFVLNQAKNPFPSGAVSPITFSSSDEGTEQVSFVDLDNDGDLDVIGSSYDNIRYFMNTGTASAPVFQEQTGANNPFNGIGNEYLAQTLSDFDNDGDFDMVMGQDQDQLRYFQNTGTASAPVFTELTGTFNPLNNVITSGYVDELVPFAVDIDNDGDFDLMLGEKDYSQIIYLKNTGTASVPAFTEQTGTFNPFNSFNPVSYQRTLPTFTDIDGDGDFDALIGGLGYSASGYDKLQFYQNTGTASNPVFTHVTGTNSPFDGFTAGDYSLFFSPAFADLDNDGDYDLFVGGNYEVQYFENTGISSAPSFNFKDLSDYTDVYANIAMVDIDNDGDKDAFVGGQDGIVFYFKNTGTASAPVLEIQTGTNNPLDAVDVDNYTSPVFVDIDGDGDQDFFVGDYNGDISYYVNAGNTTSPDFSEATGTFNPLYNGSFSSAAIPDFADIDNDGDYDLVVGSGPGGVQFLQNIGTSSVPDFSEETASAFDAISGIGSYLSPAFVDIDGDGNIDVVTGSGTDNTLFYYKNTGTPTTPDFTEQTGTLNPFNSTVLGDIGNYMVPAFADLDNDGDLDLILGLADGTVNIYENNEILTSVVKPGKSYVYSAIGAFPNPTSGSLSISIPTDLVGEAEITLSDISGNIIFREARMLTSGNLSYDNALSESPSGIYIVKIKMDNRVGIAKIVKN